MQPNKFYDPADINSSPFEPMIGQVVLFQPIRNGSIGRQKWPAMITNVCGTPDDRVDLTVFTVTGIIHVSRVPFSGDATRENVWHYMAEPVKRLATKQGLQPGLTEPSNLQEA